TVNNGGRLMGNATLNEVTINSGGIIAPGNSVGSVTLGDTTVDGGAIYQWEIAAASGTAGEHWDLVNIEGVLTLNATPTTPIVIRVLPLADVLDNGLLNPGPIAGFDVDSEYLENGGWMFAQSNNP